MKSLKDNESLIVLNMFGGPGAGKSTTAAGVFALMKEAGMSVELVTEFAKDATWEERHNLLAVQEYILAEQNLRLRRLVGKVQFAVTDSPLLLSTIYTDIDYPVSFRWFVEDMFNSYSNFNFLIKRTKPYVQIGRNQDEDQARRIDAQIASTLSRLGHKTSIVIGDGTAKTVIFDFVQREILECIT